MLKLEECQQALALDERKQEIEARLVMLANIDCITVTAPAPESEVRSRFATDTAMFLLTGEGSHGWLPLPRTTLEGIRTLLIAAERGRLAEVERKLAQLVVRD